MDVTEVRMGYAPARPATCDVKVVNVRAGTSGYEVLGYIRVVGDGGLDPFDRALLSDIRPRACKMGGEQLALQVSSPTSAMYAVLKPKAL